MVYHSGITWWRSSVVCSPHSGQGTGRERERERGREREGRKREEERLTVLGVPGGLSVPLSPHPRLAALGSGEHPAGAGWGPGAVRPPSWQRNSGSGRFSAMSVCPSVFVSELITG
jgi:hypothetical protein